MNRQTRFIASIILAAALLLSGCAAKNANTPDPSDSTDTDQSDSVQAPSFGDLTIIDRTEKYENAAASYLAALPSMDLEGSSFIIASPRTDLIEPAEDGTVYAKAKYERNKLIEEKYNVRLTASYVSEAEYTDAVRQSVQTDEYYADLLMLPQNMIGTFAANDLLMNLNSLPFFRTDMPFFDASSVDAASVGHKTYAVAGAASFEESMLTAVYFNRGLFEANGISLPYGDVYDGTWTWDRFFEICASVPDLDGTYASYSTQYSADTLPACVFFSSGESFIRKSGTAAPVLAYTDNSPNAFSVLHALYTEPNAHTDTASGVSRFYSGESLFMIDRLYLMSWMINGTQNWGILPMPKADADASYVSLTAPDTLFFAAQKNTVNADSTSIILSALNAASYGVLSDAYITHAMQNILRDNDSANMLEIMTNTRTYDFAFTFGNADPTLASATYLGLKNTAPGGDFTALTAQKESINAYLSETYPAGN